MTKCNKIIPLTQQNLLVGKIFLIQRNILVTFNKFQVSIDLTKKLVKSDKNFCEFNKTIWIIHQNLFFE